MSKRGSGDGNCAHAQHPDTPFYTVRRRGAGATLRNSVLHHLPRHIPN